MKIRRFFAKDMRSALKEISREMGPEAAILSTNNVTGGIEIVAATDYDEAIKISKQTHTPKIKQAKARSLMVEPETSEPALDEKLLDKAPISELRNEFFENQKKLKRNKQQPERMTNPSQQKVRENFTKAVEPNYESNSMDWGSDPIISKVHDELKLLRNLVQVQLAESDWNKRQQKQPIESEIMKRLVALGLPVQLADYYAAEARDIELDDAWYKIAATIAHDIPVYSDNIIEEGGCYALIGPTGVGKTTTVAKLAAMAVNQYGSDAVALISTDSYRIAAHEQLAIYAQIMGIEVVSVADKQQLDDALRGFSDKKIVLIDTAGIGQRDKRLTEQLDCLESNNHKIKHLLVLSATSQLANLNESIKRFGQFKLEGAILTKLDEATSLGVLLATVIRAQLPLYYVTDGQNVPDDIQPATAHRLITEAISLSNQYPQETAEQWRIAQNLQRVS